MDRAILAPSPECLAEVVEQDAERTPQNDQAHVRHDRRHEAGLLDPNDDELRKAVPPEVLVDGDGDHERACDWLI